jgi:hypothetical protein
MPKSPILRVLFVISVIVIGFGSGEELVGQDTKNERSEPFEVVRIYTDHTGESHFCHTKVSFSLIDYAPPAPAISVSEIFDSQGLVFISSPPGWHGDWHPAPRKQYMICLEGELEVTVSDGETRRFGPGNVILVEDTSGKGHISKVVGNERCFMVAVPLENNLE